MTKTKSINQKKNQCGWVEAMLLRNAALKKQLQKAEVSGQSTSALAKQIAEPLGRLYGADFMPFEEDFSRKSTKT